MSNVVYLKGLIIFYYFFPWFLSPFGLPPPPQGPLPHRHQCPWRLHWGGHRGTLVPPWTAEKGPWALQLCGWGGAQEIISPCLPGERVWEPGSSRLRDKDVGEIWRLWTILWTLLAIISTELSSISKYWSEKIAGSKWNSITEENILSSMSILWKVWNFLTWSSFQNLKKNPFALSLNSVVGTVCLVIWYWQIYRCSSVGRNGPWSTWHICFLANIWLLIFSTRGQ